MATTMTGDELDRAIAFLLDNQAKLDVKLDRLEQTVEHLVGSHERLVGSQERLAESAAVDRAETRDAVQKMLAFAEEMSDNVRLLATAQQGSTQRITSLETRVDRLESPNP